MLNRRTLGVSALGLLLIGPARADAEWQIRPFIGVAFGGSTTLVDLEHAATGPHMVFGVTGGLLGEILGLEADFSVSPGFFETGRRHLVTQGSVTTFTGGVVLAFPRSLTEYTLRPYVAGGVGLMRVRIDDSFDVLQVSTTLPAFNVGGGVIGYLTDSVGVSWDVRRLQSIGRKVEGRGFSFGREELSFWRANMALAIRY
jgi:hypothetical protein